MPRQGAKEQEAKAKGMSTRKRRVFETSSTASDATVAAIGTQQQPAAAAVAAQEDQENQAPAGSPVRKLRRGVGTRYADSRALGGVPQPLRCVWREFAIHKGLGDPMCAVPHTLCMRVRRGSPVHIVLRVVFIPPVGASYPVG